MAIADPERALCKSVESLCPAATHVAKAPNEEKCKASTTKKKCDKKICKWKKKKCILRPEGVPHYMYA